MLRKGMSFEDVVNRVATKGGITEVGTWPKSFKKFFMILGIIAGAVIGSRILLFFFQWLLNQINTEFGILTYQRSIFTIRM